MTQVAEFDSSVKNGKIVIPPQYRDEIPQSVRVMVFAKEKRQTGSKKDKNLYSLGVDMAGFVFNRDEANEH
jgi:hypothetical protein